MASAGGKRVGGGGDRVVEGRHLIGVFLGVVVLCGVFFTLGWVMGRTQPDAGLGVASASTSEAPRKPAEPKPTVASGPAATAPTTPPADWDFYPRTGVAKSGERASSPTTAPTRKTIAGSQPAASVPAAQPSKPAAPSVASFKAPLIPRGALVLQVAALARDADALAMAEALQKRKFPAFVLAPTTDSLYRVQVGPYADSKSAEMAKRALEREGFKTILKR